MTCSNPTKNIWTYWHQGWSDAPAIVKQCGRSWEQYNPNYKIHFLDEHSVKDYVEIPAHFNLDRRDMTITKISNFVRLALLNRHGGVWVDATLMCMKPLDDWIYEHYDAEFFVFHSPDHSRLIASWFIAAEPGNKLLETFLSNYSNFFRNNYFWNKNTAIGKPISKFLTRRWRVNVKSTTLWHSWFVRKALGVYPYFILHYTFNKIIIENIECTSIWNQIPPSSAKPCLKLQRMGKKSKYINKAKQYVDSGATPVFKLNWRLDISREFWREILPYIEVKAYHAKSEKKYDIPT